MTDIPAKANASAASSGSLLLTLMKLRTFIALIVVLVNFTVDLLYIYLNPQIRVR